MISTDEVTRYVTRSERAELAAFEMVCFDSGDITDLMA